MIKIAIVMFEVCCAALAAAEAEADPALFYNNYGYGLPYTSPYTSPYSGRYLADSVGAVHLAKREAESEPEAQSGYFGYYGQALGLGHSNYGFGFSSPVFSNYANYVRPSIYGGYGLSGRYHY